MPGHPIMGWPGIVSYLREAKSYGIKIRNANRDWLTKFDNFDILMPGGVEIVKTECM